MPQGDYRLRPQILPAGYSIVDVRQGGRSVAAEAISVGAGPAEPVEVILSRMGGKVDVTIESSPGKAPAASSVSLVPVGGRFGNPLFYQRKAAASGKATFDSVAPGEYRLHAWEVLPAGADENAEFMARYESRGRLVTVRPGAEVQASVPLSRD